jgi:hypothetical protein
MLTFWQWLSRFKSSLLGETYFTFDRAQYDRLFDEELHKVLARTTDPTHREALERMKGFHWTGYVAAAVRHAGWRDEREVQERTHDIVVPLLTGKLFAGFDQEVSGPFDLRFRCAVGNAIRNMIERERNRHRLLPTVPLDPASEPGRWSRAEDDEKLIQDFRGLVRRRLGGLALAVLDVRLAGGETKSLVGSPQVGSPDKNVIKKVVQQVKQLARDYAERLGDPIFIRDIERAMGREAATVQKRRATMAGRRAAVA